MEQLRLEKLCRLIGFNQKQTDQLVTGKSIVYSGDLYSEEHKRTFTAEKAGFQVMRNPTDEKKLVLSINRQPISDWFKEQFNKLCQIMKPEQEQNRSRGFRL